MAEVVDAVVAELVLRGLQQYETGFDRATAAHGRFQKSVDGLKGQTFDLQAEAQKYRQGGNTISGAAEQTDAKITRSRKKRAADSVAADEAEVRSAKRAAKERADAEIAETQRSARYRAMAERAAARQRIPVSPNVNNPNRFGTDLSRPTQASFIPASALGASAADVAATGEVDHLTADIADKQARLAIARGRDRDILREQLGELRLIKQLQAAGLDDAAIAVKLDERALAIEAERAAVAKGRARQNLTRFAEGAGVGRSYGSIATVGGIAAAAAVGIGVEVIQSSIEYGRALKVQSEELGINTTALQVYKKAASDLDVSQEQLTAGLGQLSANLGKAQDGAQEQGKIFRALGIDVGNAKDGLKSLDQVLPELIDRLSSIQDQSQRAAIETALFGEQGRRLDGLLSGGTDAVNNLADGMQRAGAVLSPADIQKLDQAGKVLSSVKQQLEVDIAGVVASNAKAIEALAEAFGKLVNGIGNAVSRYIQFLKITGSPSQAFTLAGMTAFTPDDNGRDELSSGKNLGLGIPKGDTGKVDQSALAKLFAPKPCKGRTRRGPTAEQISADIAARDQSLDAEYLAAKAALTQDAEDRAKAANAQLDAELASYDRSLADDKKLTKADRDRLAAKEAQVVAEKRKKVALDKDAQIAEDDLRLRQADRSAYQDELRSEEALATTAAARRRLELAALRSRTEAETDAARTALKTNPENSAAYQQAQNDLDPNNPNGISGRSQHEEAAIRAGTRGPLADYLSRLPRTAEDVDEALQQAAANGLQSLNDGLSTAVDKFLHLHGIAGQFLSDLIKIGIEREVFIPLVDRLFPTASKEAGGAPTGGNIFNTIASAVGSFFGGGRAVGGPVSPGQFYEVGERGREWFKPNVPGTIIPNNAINPAPMNQRIAQPAPQARPTEIVLHVQSNDYFDAKVHSISGAVAAETSVRVVQAAAPGIARMGAQASPSVIQRQQKLGPS